jgi:hypothetical protein
VTHDDDVAFTRRDGVDDNPGVLQRPSGVVFDRKIRGHGRMAALLQLRHEKLPTPAPVCTSVHQCEQAHDDRLTFPSKFVRTKSIAAVGRLL